MAHHCSTPTLKRASRPTARRRETRVRFQVEYLEVRSLLTSTSSTFVVPNMKLLIQSPQEVAKTTPTIFSDLLGELQSRVEQGPLAVLTHENITVPESDAFVTGVSAVVSSWEQEVARQLPHNPSLVHLLDLQGTALTDTEVQWQVRFQAGLYPTITTDPTYNYLKDATTTVRQLTESRPLWPMGTPNLALYKRADTLAHTLASDVVNTLMPESKPLLNPDTAEAVGLAEASAFQADFDASLTARPRIDRIADEAVATLENNLSLIVQQGIDPLTQAQHAQQQFVSQMLVGAGLFGPLGPLSKDFQAPANPFDNPEHTVFPPDMTPANTPDGSQYAKMYTFTDAKVTMDTLTPPPTTYFRVFSDPPAGFPDTPPENNYKGAFLSTQEFFNPVTAIRAEALDQSWYHPSYTTMKVNVVAKQGTIVYVGTVAPILQGVYAPERHPSLYPGGANQTVILDRSVSYIDPRSIGANP